MLVVNGDNFMLLTGASVLNKQKNDFSEEEYQIVKEYLKNVSSHSMDKMIDIFLNEKAKEKILSYNKAVKEIEGLDTFEPYYKVEEGVFFRRGIPIALPISFIKKYNEADEEGRNALDNFWIWCAQNPDPVARKGLFDFLMKYGFYITNSGHFVAFRNANIKVEGNKMLNDFVATQYAKVKKWKKSPSKFNVIAVDNVYISQKANKPIEHGKLVGTLHDLYHNKTSDKTIYTDKHSGKTTIVIGEYVEIPRELCDSDPNVTCSKGLHVAGAGWLSQGYYGEVGLMCLVNPKDVVAVPHEDNYGKMRVCRYFPYSLYERVNGKIVMPDSIVMDDLVEADLKEIEEINPDYSFINKLKNPLDNLKRLTIRFEDFVGLNKSISGYDEEE